MKQMFDDIKFNACHRGGLILTAFPVPENLPEIQGLVFWAESLGANRDSLMISINIPGGELGRESRFTNDFNIYAGRQAWAGICDRISCKTQSTKHIGFARHPVEYILPQIVSC